MRYTNIPDNYFIIYKGCFYESKKFLNRLLFSTGKTKKSAKTSKRLLDCDIESIKDNTSRTGFLGFMKSGFQAFRGLTCNIEPAKAEPSKYDMVKLGTPVWAGHVSSPVRTVHMITNKNLKALHFFVPRRGMVMTRFSMICLAFVPYAQKLR